MGKKNLSAESKQHLKSQWTEALAKGLCPFAGCDLTKATCKHLDSYLEYVDNPHTNYSAPESEAKKAVPKKRVRTLYTSDIDDFSLRMPKDQRPSLWELFKKLRQYGLSRDQIGLLLRIYGLNMTYRQILADMNWVSHDTIHRRHLKALALLKKRGFGNE